MVKVAVWTWVDGKVLVTPVRRAKEERIRQLVNGIHHKHPIISRTWLHGVGRYIHPNGLWFAERPQKARLGKDAKARAGVDYGGIQFHGHRQSSQTRVYEITTQKLPGRLVVGAKLRWE